MLVYPLDQVCLFFVLAIVLRLFGFARSAFSLFVIAFLWLYLCSTDIVANRLMGYLEAPYSEKPIPQVETADAIVLLGGSMRGHTLQGTFADLNQQADRLVRAVALYKANKAPLILVTGGAPIGDRSEAEQIADILEVMGVDKNDILLEKRSRNTHDNAVYSKTILRNHDLRRIHLVTSAFHLRRSVPLFERYPELQVLPEPTDFQRIQPSNSPQPSLGFPLPSLASLSRTTYAIHELVGYQVYRWRGWI